MPLLDKDAVLTTREAIKYLKISKPTYPQIYSPWKDQGGQSGKRLEGTPIRVASISKGEDVMNKKTKTKQQLPP